MADNDKSNLTRKERRARNAMKRRQGKAVAPSSRYRMPPAGTPGTVTINTHELGARYQRDMQILADASQQHLFDSDDPIMTRRRAVLLALVVMQSTYRDLHFPPRLLDPIDHLISALFDLDHGIVDPLLEVRAGTENRGASQTEWQARAFAAGACEALTLNGMGRPDAAHVIAKQLPEMDRLTKTKFETDHDAVPWRAKKIKGDAEALNNPNSKNGGPLHEMAVHRPLYEGIQTRLTEIARMPSASIRAQMLENESRNLVNRARRWLLRLPLRH